MTRASRTTPWANEMAPPLLVRPGRRQGCEKRGLHIVRSALVHARDVPPLLHPEVYMIANAISTRNAETKQGD